MKITKQDVLEYHAEGRPGKIEVIATKRLANQRDLSLAYSPGVAEAVLEVERDPNTAYQYTAKGNLVAVVSNGTAILGLGNRGALASKPVMEGKGVLFKTFADVDVFDIELNATDPDEIIKIVKALAPTFGGINLEDIKAPECFYIEETLKRELDIPVFHDDQHGTAVISGAALLNACEINGKKLEDLKLAFLGAGASSIATAEFYVALGCKRENIIMCDTKGVIHTGRTDLNEYKARFAVETTKRTYDDAIEGTDVIVGLASANIVTPTMLETMNDHPLIFAMANPDPEIPYEIARQVRPDAIIGTGRSDYPNQINNVLGFPFIFRGALDVAATAINEPMKIAAAKALAALAHEDVPDSVLAAYGKDSITFGPEYVIPTPLDPRVMMWVSPAVAQAAMESGVARKHIDIEEYRDQLARRQGSGRRMRRYFINIARQNPKKLVFAEGHHRQIIRAAAQIQEEGIAHPILIGFPDVIHERIAELGLDFKPKIVNPKDYPQHDKYAEAYFDLRKRKGITAAAAREATTRNTILGPLMVYMGEADAYLAGVAATYPEIIRPALQIFHTRADVKKAAGLYILLIKGKTYIVTDATVNIDPNTEDLAEIAILAHDFAKRIEMPTPTVAMLSFSNFGSTPHPLSNRVAEATELVRQRRPDILIDGEVQADFAVDGELMEAEYPFSQIRSANVLVFPQLGSANISYKLLKKLGGAETIGPILVGLGAPVHVLAQGDSVEEIVAMAAVAVMDAQQHQRS